MVMMSGAHAMPLGLLGQEGARRLESTRGSIFQKKFMCHTFTKGETNAVPTLNAHFPDRGRTPAPAGCCQVR